MEESITKRMREATREIHNLSDALVNAKLAFALNSNEVWADGLTVFYEVFKFLEANVPNLILPREYYRTESFERDLSFYKGNEWQKTYKPRKSVLNYLQHLHEVKESNPLNLIAYVYHLYMGLLSGGQILAKKRKIKNKMTRNFSTQRDDDINSEENIEPGTHLTSFPNQSILELKNNLRQIIDDFCKDFDNDVCQELIAESKTVFILNNQVIQSVEGVTKQNLKMFGYFLIVILSIYIFLKMWVI